MSPPPTHRPITQYAPPSSLRLPDLREPRRPSVHGAEARRRYSASTSNRITPT